jgi:hypothetical protein
MHADLGTARTVKLRAAANDNSRAHPAWRRLVAGGMALVFAFSLAVVGLMLCIAPSATP